jgi:anti-anti-sigma regulatory factor
MRAEVVAPSPRARLVTFAGDLDAVGARVMAEVFEQKTAPTQDIAVDLMAVRQLSTAGAAALYEVGSRAAEAGGRLAVAVPPGGVARSLAVCRRSATIAVVDSRAAALAEIGGSDADLPPPTTIDVVGMRNRVFISQALAVIQCRYSLQNTDTAFRLLCTVSQRNNVSVRVLAGALLNLRPPEGERWFPARATPYAPVLSFCPHAPTPGATLTAALDATAGALGAVHSVDPFRGGLVLEHHRGLSDELADHLAVMDTSTAGALAQQSGMVVVDDVATDPRLAAEARAVLLRAGVVAVRSIPLVARDRDCLGVLSLYHAESPAPPVSHRLTRVAAETSRWLDWYRRTVVFDALERLHQCAQSAPRRAVTPRRRSRL